MMNKVYNVIVRTWLTPGVRSALRGAGYTVVPRKGNCLVDVRPDMTVTKTEDADRTWYRPYFEPYTIISQLRTGARVDPRPSFLEYLLDTDESDAHRVRIGCSRFERRSVEEAIAVSDRMVRRSISARRNVDVRIRGWNGDRDRELTVDTSGAIGRIGGSMMPREGVLRFKKGLAKVKQ